MTNLPTVEWLKKHAGMLNAFYCTEEAKMIDALIPLVEEANKKQGVEAEEKAFNAAKARCKELGFLLEGSIISGRGPYYVSANGGVWGSLEKCVAMAEKYGDKWSKPINAMTSYEVRDTLKTLGWYDGMDTHSNEYLAGYLLGRAFAGGLLDKQDRIKLPKEAV